MNCTGQDWKVPLLHLSNFSKSLQLLQSLLKHFEVFLVRDLHQETPNIELEYDSSSIQQQIDLNKFFFRNKKLFFVPDSDWRTRGSLEPWIISKGFLTWFAKNNGDRFFKSSRPKKLNCKNLWNFVYPLLCLYRHQTFWPNHCKMLANRGVLTPIKWSNLMAQQYQHHKQTHQE